MSLRPLDWSTGLQAARAALTRGDHVGCVETATALYGQAQHAGALLAAADAALLLGRAHSNNDDGRTSLLWAEKALQASQQAGAADREAAAWVVLAIAAAASDDPARAMQAVDRALQFVQRDDYSLQQVESAFTGIGLTYSSLGMPMHALQSLRRAVDAAQRGGDTATLQRTMLNLVYVSTAAADQLQPVDAAAANAIVEDAAAHIGAIEDCARRLNSAFARAGYCNSVGQLLTRLGRPAEAVRLLTELTGLPVEASATTKRDSWLDLAEAQRRCGDTAGVAASVEKATQYQARIEHPPRLEDLPRLAAMEELRGNPAQALHWHRLHHARTLHNVLAALDGRVAELTAQVAEQSLRLENSDLRFRNAGLAESVRQISRIATTDPLTGVLNRRGLEETFARIAASGTPMALAMLDLDHFKQVNDQFSHAVGDAVLRKAAALMSETLRGPDCVGRYGGEEFTVLLAAVDATHAAAVAERLRHRIASFDWPSLARGLSVTTSVGVVCVQHGQDFAQVSVRADELLYRAKLAGRDRVVSEAVQA